jgi:hypothetical protein
MAFDSEIAVDSFWLLSAVPLAATMSDSWMATAESARAIARSENHDRPADESDGEASYDEWRNVVHSDTIGC